MTEQLQAPAIRVRGLEKSFKDLHVLRGVDLEIARGSIFALLGSNGSGKTTTVKIRGLQEHRRRIAQLATGDSLAVPDEVADYLDRVRAIGAPESLIEAERDAWILVAARYPDQIAAFMDDKVRQLEDPRTVRFYRLISRMLSGGEEEVHEHLVRETADLLVEMFEDAAASGQLAQQDLDMDDSAFVQLLDSMAEGHPMVARLQELIAERGWTGWTRIERASRSGPGLPRQARPADDEPPSSTTRKHHPAEDRLARRVSR